MIDDWRERSDDELDEREYPDPDEDDDLSDTTPCPACGADVFADAPACPVCGHYIAAETSAWSGRPVWWIVLGAIGVVALLVFLLRG